MQNLFVVTMFHGERNLGEPIEQFVFGEVVHASRAIFLLEPLLNFGLQIAAICVVHNNTQLSFLCLVDFSKADDVRVVEHFEDLGFVERFPPLLFTHLSNVNLFDDRVRVVRLALHEVGRAERANSERRHLLVRFKCFGWGLLGFHHVFWIFVSLFCRT